MEIALQTLDINFAEDKFQEVVGRIQKRTGENHEAVEKAVKEAPS